MPGAITPAAVIAEPVDHVEGRRRPEINDDQRRLISVLRGDLR